LKTIILISFVQKIISHIARKRKGERERERERDKVRKTIITDFERCRDDVTCRFHFTFR
jgi:hypothetical protein